MHDNVTTIDDLKKIIKQFTQERDWDRFLFPKTISTYLSLEAAELLEKFLWADNESSRNVMQENRKEIEHELADVFYWVLQMCWLNNIDLSKALKEKLEHNAQKYPVEKIKGLKTKYTNLQ